MFARRSAGEDVTGLLELTQNSSRAARCGEHLTTSQIFHSRLYIRMETPARAPIVLQVPP